MLLRGRIPGRLLFEYLAVRLNGPKAAGKKVALNLNFTDLKKQIGAVVENGVLNYFTKPVEKADASITVAKPTLDQIQLKERTMRAAIKSGELKVAGRKEATETCDRYSSVAGMPVRCIAFDPISDTRGRMTRQDADDRLRRIVPEQILSFVGWAGRTGRAKLGA